MHPEANSAPEDGVAAALDVVNGGINVARDPCSLDIMSHGVCLHHETADERPAFAGQFGGEFKSARPWFSPAFDGLGDGEVIAHASADLRASIRCFAALLVRVSP